MSVLTSSLAVVATDVIAAPIRMRALANRARARNGIAELDRLFWVRGS